MSYITTLPRSSQFWNFVEVYPVLLHFRAFPNFETVLIYTPSFHIAEKSPTLKYCWCIPCPATLLSCSQFWNFADVYHIFLHCWKFSTLKVCWGNTYLLILLLCSPSYDIASADLIFLRCWDVPKIGTLLRYTLSCYIAKLFPILRQW